MQRIAQEAGLARSTLYLAFPDKSKLLIALAEDATAGLFDTAAAWWSGADRDAHEALLTGTRAMIAGFRAQLPVLLALSEVAAYDAEVGRYWGGRVNSFVQIVTARLAEEQQRHGQVGSFDPVTTARILTWMFERSISTHCRLDDGAGDDALARDLSRIVWLTVQGQTG